LFNWLRTRRRQRIMARPFPEEWEWILETNAHFFERLNSNQQTHIRRAIQVFVAEKNWEGCGGQTMRDSHRVTIAAQMARMTLGLPAEYFDEVRSILLYPDAYLAKGQDMLGSTVVEGDSARLGEAWYRGPVILSWIDVLATGREENYGRNVVVHEFAHQLDMRNGRHADGVPPIESQELADRWLEVVERDYERLTEYCRSGVSTILDCYGTTNHAEFFAVASEAYFEQPRQLDFDWPELYEILQLFYGDA
jgi:Mlc titration factor MtfA (ptsG expression regulator)